MSDSSGTRLFLGMLIAALALCDGFTARAGTTAPADDKVAEVNGVPILRRNFQIDYRQAVRAHAQKGNPVNEAYLRDLRSNLIDYLVETELLMQDAARQGIAITPQELDQSVAAARAASGNDLQFRADLRNTGISLEEFRSRRRQELTIKKLIATRIAPDARVSDQEIQDYYQQNAERFRIAERLHIHHIARHLPPDADETQKSAVRQRILSLKRQIAAGDDFAELARQFSEDASRAKGGDLGFIDAGQASLKFGPQVLTLPTGQVSDPLETPSGFHLVTVEARQPSREIPLASVREGIRRQLYRQKSRAPVKAYVKALRQRAQIVIYN
ncbi:MAG: peptidylprolyl isomerase [Desulfobacterales bacterium]|jgi:parvulin-like peptidyl-prolyl isomerase